MAEHIEVWNPAPLPSPALDVAPIYIKYNIINKGGAYSEVRSSSELNTEALPLRATYH